MHPPRVLRSCTLLLAMSLAGACAHSPQERMRMGCEAGEADQCLAWGASFEEAPQTMKRAALAHTAYARACQGGSAEGCVRDGMLILTAFGLPPAWKEAREALAQGCVKGSGEACLRLGEMHDTGIGAPEDAALALDLYRQACDGKVELACKRVAELERMARLDAEVEVEVEARRKKREEEERVRGAPLEPAAVGGLDREVINRVIRGLTRRVQYCYEVALGTGLQLEGKLALEFGIAPTGDVFSARVKEAVFPSPTVAACILDVFRTARFPAEPNGGSTIVHYPYVFKLGDARDARGPRQ